MNRMPSFFLFPSSCHPLSPVKKTERVRTEKGTLKGEKREKERHKKKDKKKTEKRKHKKK